MRNKGTRTVKLADLQMNLFVRKALNQDHALYLADLIENGVQLRDLIEVTDRDGVMNIVVEGRHRKEAYELNNVAEVKVKVLEFDDEAEMIAYAYKANTGGSLPPTLQDTEHTIMMLLERGEAMKRIGELLGLPAGMARKYINSVKSKTSRQKLMKAASAITDGGLTVAKAAEQYEVDADALKQVLSGHKRKHKMGVAEVQRGLTKTYKSLSSKNAALIRSLLEKYEDGDVTERQVREIFAHIEQLQKRSTRAVSDWKKRFDAANGKPAKAS
jgi:hypothetical protein